MVSSSTAAAQATARLAVNGAAGRMGRQLLAAIGERNDARLVAAADAPGQASIGIDVSVLTGAPGIAGTAAPVNDGGSQSPVIIRDSLQPQLADIDVVIDFTTPRATLALLDAVKGSDTRVVIGTTGFNESELATLNKLSQTQPIVFAANYSIGVTVSMQLLKQAARALAQDYDIEIIEAHHRHKVDAPSGTALAMGETIARAIGRNLKECAVYGREGITGPRDRETIGFETVRAGDIIGEHTVLFAGNGERLEITHRATDRMTFARGAVQAAVWLKQQPAGLYDMTHVLGIAGEIN